MTVVAADVAESDILREVGLGEAGCGEAGYGEEHHGERPGEEHTVVERNPGGEGRRPGVVGWGAACKVEVERKTYLHGGGCNTHPRALSEVS